MNEYYVYVYIDPRNFEEFYYGKGKGSRKDYHIYEDADSAKSRRIKKIKDEGLLPIVRVIAANLTESDALLVEKTLLWKLGSRLTNVSTGHYSEKFRPHNTLHKKINGFDYQNSLYYFNIGEGETRCWDDFKKFGFISAGQGIRWRDQILTFKKNDCIAAYLKGFGYVGIGRITSEPKPINEVKINGCNLLDLDLKQPNISKNIDCEEMCEHVALINWIRAVDSKEAKWIPKSGLYTTPLVKASLEAQTTTIAFLEANFDVSFETLLT